MSGWYDATIADLCARTTSGGTPSRRRPEFFCEPPAGIPWVRSQELVDRRITSCGEHITEAGLKGSSAKIIPPDTVLVAMYGATVGQLGYLDIEAATNQAICALITDPAVTDPRYLYYALMQERGRLVEAAHGAAQQNLSQASIRSFSVRVPGLILQRRIAEILTALDDLIENNRRRVRVLGEIVRAIYREWFVHFRYPGHDHVPLVDSPLGPIPDGWAVRTCGDELTALGGGTPSKKEPAFWEDGEIRWFTPSDLTKSGLRYAAEPEWRITPEGLARSSARLFPPGSVLMTSRATLGVLAIATVEATTNQGFIVIPPDERWSPGFIYEWLDSHAGDLASIATGATFKEITKGAFKRVPFVVPAQDVLDAHTKVTEPLEAEIRVLEEQTRCLASLRDLLLPKLVTGQIDVSDLEPDALTGAAVA